MNTHMTTHARGRRFDEKTNVILTGLAEQAQARIQALLEGAAARIPLVPPFSRGVARSAGGFSVTPQSAGVTSIAKHGAGVAGFSKRQQGFALFVGLVFMLLLTIIGLTAVRFSTQQGRMALSFQSQIAVFQGAEGAIRSLMCEIRTPATCPHPSGQVDPLITATNAALDTPVAPRTYTLASDTGLTSSTTIAYNGQGPVPGYSLGVDQSSIAAHNFTIDATSTHSSTAATAGHLQGVQRVGPAI